MSTLADLFNLDELERLIQARYIKRRPSPDGRHVILDYADRATFDRVWTPETTRCRGLIARVRDGRIEGRPFDKFFNLNEPGIAHAALSALPPLDAIRITAKLDGSMITVWHDAEQNTWRCATRGNFASDQAIAAHAWLSDRIDFRRLDPTYTYIGEWCAPDNRVVVRYPDAALSLLALRHLETGLEAEPEVLAATARELGLSIAPAYPAGSIDEVLLRAAEARGVEGWVLSWRTPAGYTERLKVKTAEYIALNALIANFSVKRVHEALVAGRFDDYALQLPDELQGEARRIAAEVWQRVEARVADLNRRFDQLCPLLQDSRRAFALALQQEPAGDRPFLFLLADGREIGVDVLAKIDLQGVTTRFGQPTGA
ncbi:MAG: hypothetical protein JNL73_12685 [Anaerolineales bacterium]|nr:hypothetical protein [Anaerolineales bacterium]